jgi:ribose 1,5-bisphosphokinase
MSGAFIALVGPSGAGKDSLIAGARRHFASHPGIGFVRRVITRPPDIHEDHEPVSAEEFQRRAEAGGFALFWHANGLSYGLPASVHLQLQNGIVMVANVSRDSVPRLRAAFARALVVHVTANSEVLCRRLAQRSRESAEEQDARLARALRLDKTVAADIRIENNGQLSEAQKRFVGLLCAFVPPQPRGEAKP